MSQYRDNYKHEGRYIGEIYGHDHAMGYFADIYVGGYDYDGPTIQLNEMFGRMDSPAFAEMDSDLQDFALGRVSLRYNRIRTGADECEKMIRDASHTGHSVAEVMAALMGKELPASTRE